MKKGLFNYRLPLKKDTLTFSILGLVSLVALTTITFRIVTSRNTINTQSEALVRQSTNIVFVDQNKTPISETKSVVVNVMLTSPWAATSGIARVEADQAVAGSDTVLGESTTVLQVKSSTDDVNEDGNSFQPTQNTLWIGNSQSRTASWTGMRFSNVQIPRNAVIKSAKLSLYSPQQQWITMKFTAYADTTANSAAFTSSSKPSQRTLTANSVPYQSNTKWNANSWYVLNEMKTVVQEVINRSDWQPGNNLSVLLKGTGASWGRKFVQSYDQDPSNAPKLSITYTSGIVDNTPTPTTTSIPTATPVPPTVTNTPIPTDTPIPPTVTLTPYTTTVELAEDSEFTKNYVKFSYISHPMNVTYTFMDANPGQKTLYARFTSSTGQTQVFSNSIDLVATDIPTETPIPPTGSIWGVIDPVILGNCSAAVHDKYVVDGNDGFLYRTWHPQVDPSGCVFAHEHGDNPDTMQDPWVRANWDPRFGYAARRMTSAAEPNGHVEAHEGYKVFSANVGIPNDEGRVNLTASLSTFHMGTGGPKRFTVQFHSNNIAYRYKTGTPYAATSLMLDTGSVSDVCDPRSPAPTKDGITLQNRCKLNSAYEIWGTFQTIKSGSREIYRVFATPAVFDPITVFNRDNPLEVVYAWDPRVAAIKMFNDDWSDFRGCIRENYAQVGYFYNAGGPTTYYTDPMGNVVSDSTPGAIRQVVSASDSVGLKSTEDNIAFKKRTSYCQNSNNLGLKN